MVPLPILVWLSNVVFVGIPVAISLMAPSFLVPPASFAEALLECHKVILVGAVTLSGVALVEVIFVFKVLVDEEDASQQERGDQVQPVLRKVLQLQRRPRHHHRHRRRDQDDGVDRAKHDVQLAVRPLRRATTQDDVGGEQRAEQHDLGREEQPDPELAVGQAGVGSLCDGIGDVHRVFVSFVGLGALVTPFQVRIGG